MRLPWSVSTDLVLGFELIVSTSFPLPIKCRNLDKVLLSDQVTKKNTHSHVHLRCVKLKFQSSAGSNVSVLFFVFFFFFLSQQAMTLLHLVVQFFVSPLSCYIVMAASILWRSVKRVSENEKALKRSDAVALRTFLNDRLFCWLMCMIVLLPSFIRFFVIGSCTEWNISLGIVMSYFGFQCAILWCWLARVVPFVSSQACCSCLAVGAVVFHGFIAYCTGNAFEFIWKVSVVPLVAYALTAVDYRIGLLFLGTMTVISLVLPSSPRFGMEAVFHVYFVTIAPVVNSICGAGFIFLLGTVD